MEKVRFFRYSGTKNNYTETINELINTSDNEIYIEPFVGSGAILFNLEKEFKKYIINDIDRNIINIYKTFKEIDYSYYKEKLDFILEKFTSEEIGFSVSSKHSKDSYEYKKTKENYYSFRNWFNENHYCTNTKDEGIYCFMLANMVINSLLRFGPNGMNSSWGNRFYGINEKNFNIIKQRLQKTEIYNEDYKSIFKKYPNALYFLDPPYFSQDSSYKGFTEGEFKEFLDIIKNKEYIYTDIINKYNENIEDKKLIRKMQSTSPLTRRLEKNHEYLFSPLLKNIKEIGIIEDEW